ncbi:hypothetical protein [Catellatospora paridis]|uniref:hypothetical protein n=1 Tax=Catellatospora paridis TaxID=1617086 RepID=UPI0012D471BF|nr:hypothetical protein [Catellatospora paridis]
MLVLWPDAAEVLRDMLRDQGSDPHCVESPEAAWRVFWAFLAIDIDGLEPKQAGLEDGFEVSWGRPSWSDGLPSLSFCRHLSVDASAAWPAPTGYAPERWKLSLDMVFRDQAAFADVGELNTQGSGVYHGRRGPAMADALREVLWEVEHLPTLQALWRSTPLWSTVSFGLRGLRSRPVENFDAKQMAAYDDWRARHG